MHLKPSFLLAILLTVISSSVVFDSSRAEGYEASLNTFREFTNLQRGTTKPRISSAEDVDGMRRGFENAQQPSQIACICGLSSFKCCYIKPMLREIKKARRNLVSTVRKDDNRDELKKEWLKPEDLQ